MPQNVRSDWNETFPDKHTLGRAGDHVPHPDEDDSPGAGPIPGVNEPYSGADDDVRRREENDPLGQQ